MKGEEVEELSCQRFDAEEDHLRSWIDSRPQYAPKAR